MQKVFCTRGGLRSIKLDLVDLALYLERKPFGEKAVSRWHAKEKLIFDSLTPLLFVRFELLEVALSCGHLKLFEVLFLIEEEFLRSLIPDCLKDVIFVYETDATPFLLGVVALRRLEANRNLEADSIQASILLHQKWREVVVGEEIADASAFIRIRYVRRLELVIPWQSHETPLVVDRPARVVEGGDGRPLDETGVLDEERRGNRNPETENADESEGHGHDNPVQSLHFSCSELPLVPVDQERLESILQEQNDLGCGVEADNEDDHPNDHFSLQSWWLFAS